jgi:TRAP-type C4-dicarboxylate transport system substrate-binding protein
MTRKEERMKLARVVACLALVALLGALPAFAGGAGEGAKQYVLKFNHVLSPQDPYHSAFLK